MPITVRYSFGLSRHNLTAAQKQTITRIIRRNINRVAPVDTGKYKASWKITWKNSTLDVSSSLYYAAWVELGNVNYTYHKYKIRDAIQSALRVGVPTLPNDLELQQIPSIRDEADTATTDTGTGGGSLPSQSTGGLPPIIADTTTSSPMAQSLSLLRKVRGDIISSRVTTPVLQSNNSRKQTTNYRSLAALVALALLLENNNDKSSEESDQGDTER